MLKKIKAKLSRFKIKFTLKIGKKTKKIVLSFLAVGIVGFLLFYFKAQFVVAIVNRQLISHYSFIRELEKQGGKQILESMVTEDLVFQEAKKEGVKADQPEIDSKIKEIEKQYGFQGDDLNNFLKLQGQTRSDFEKSVKIQIIIEKILGKDISVSEEEAKKYFDDNKASLPTGSTYEQEKETIDSTLKQQKISSKLTTWLEQLKSQAKIYYFWNP